MIYFIQNTSTGAIKIGVSKKPTERAAHFQTAHTDQLVLLAVMDGDRETEQALHRTFQRINGEWFEPSADLFDYIRRHGTKVQAPAPKPVIVVRAPLEVPAVIRRPLAWVYRRLVQRTEPRIIRKPAPAPIQHSAEFERVLGYFRNNSLTEDQLVVFLAVIKQRDGVYRFPAEKIAESAYRKPRGRPLDDAIKNAVLVRVNTLRSMSEDQLRSAFSDAFGGKLLLGS